MTTREEKAKAQLASLRAKKQSAHSGGAGGAVAAEAKTPSRLTVEIRNNTPKTPLHAGSWSRFIDRNGTGQETDIDILLGWRSTPNGEAAVEFDSDDEDSDEEDEEAHVRARERVRALLCACARA